MDAATEIGLAVIATSMTLVAVFLPTAIMGGIPGLSSSSSAGPRCWRCCCRSLVARLITPMLAARLSDPSPGEPQRSRMLDWYVSSAGQWCAANTGPPRDGRGTGFFFGSLALIPLLPTSFIPAGDRSQTHFDRRRDRRPAARSTKRASGRAGARDHEHDPGASDRYSRRSAPRSGGWHEPQRRRQRRQTCARRR